MKTPRLPGGVPEFLRRKRDGDTLDDDAIAAFVEAVTRGEASDSQIAAFTMAVCLRGMSARECAALTHAMAASGDRIDWSAAALDGPLVDKHSTGGVGDKVSLLLAPALAACGAYVPMISGRGLGHTGGTLDKLEAIPGYRVDVDEGELMAVVRDAGCAIVGANAALAPADRRMYAVRDITATVESVPLITASILSKKIASGVGHLVMDVKTGSGAFTPQRDTARELARSLVSVGNAASLPTEAFITDMNQVLGTSAGNALEVVEVVEALRGQRCDPRLFEVTLALGGPLLVAAGLADDLGDGQRRLGTALADGTAADAFDVMVRALGGPAHFTEHADEHLPSAEFVADVPAPRDGVLAAVDARAIGLAVVALGGGRQSPDDRIEPAVGFDEVRGLGCELAAGEPLARVHAVDEAGARAAIDAFQGACRIEDEPPPAAPVVLERIA